MIFLIKKEGKNLTEKTALITGACGFSSSYLIPELLSAGWRVKATDLAHAPKDNIKAYLDQIEFIDADLTKKETLKGLCDGVDVVFHTAAIFSYSAPMELLRKVNVEGTKNLIEEAMNSDVKKMVLWSSVAAYGSADPKYYPMPIPEWPIEKLNPKTGGRYDLSKREQELAARKYWEENKFPITFIRPAPLYGPGSYYGISTLFRYINYEVLSFVPRNLHRSSVPLVHAKDVARAALFLSDPSKYNGEIYNIVDDNTLDMIETFRFIATLTDSALSVMIPLPKKLLFVLFAIFGKWSKFEAKYLRKKINGKPPVPKIETDSLLYLFGNFWFDNSKIKKEGFQFSYPDRCIGLIETINWYKEHGWEKPLAMPQ